MIRVEAIDVMQMCLDRIVLLKHRTNEKQAELRLAIKRNDTYDRIWELKAEIDSMNDELVHVTALHDYYDTKY